MFDLAKSSKSKLWNHNLRKKPAERLHKFLDFARDHRKRETKCSLDFAAQDFSFSGRYACPTTNFQRRKWKHSGPRGASSTSRRNRATAIFWRQRGERAMTPSIL